MTAKDLIEKYEKRIEEVNYYISLINRNRELPAFVVSELIKPLESKRFYFTQFITDLKQLEG